MDEEQVYSLLKRGDGVVLKWFPLRRMIVIDPQIYVGNNPKPKALCYYLDNVNRINEGTYWVEDLQRWPELETHVS